jgi:probable DNA metabolism protein
MMNPESIEQYSWREIAEKIQVTFQKDIRWIHASKGEELKQVIYIALRHQDDRKYDICIKTAQKAFAQSPALVLEKGCKEGKELYALNRAVTHEIRQVVAFVRFTPLGKDTLIAEVPLTHDIIDLLLIRFKKRYSSYRLVLVNGEKAVVIDKMGNIYEEDNEIYRKCLDEDDFTKYWDTYYRSQYIENRKNIKLAARALPKKYWHWVYEGKILLEEENKSLKLQ